MKISTITVMALLAMSCMCFEQPKYVSLKDQAMSENSFESMLMNELALQPDHLFEFQESDYEIEPEVYSYHPEYQQLVDKKIDAVINDLHFQDGEVKDTVRNVLMRRAMRACENWEEGMVNWITVSALEKVVGQELARYVHIWLRVEGFNSLESNIVTSFVDESMFEGAEISIVKSYDYYFALFKEKKSVDLKKANMDLEIAENTFKQLEGLALRQIAIKRRFTRATMFGTRANTQGSKSNRLLQFDPATFGVILTAITGVASTWTSVAAAFKSTNNEEIKRHITNGLLNSLSLNSAVSVNSNINEKAWPIIKRMTERQFADATQMKKDDLNDTLEAIENEVTSNFIPMAMQYDLVAGGGLLRNFNIYGKTGADGKRALMFVSLQSDFMFAPDYELITHDRMILGVYEEKSVETRKVIKDVAHEDVIKLCDMLRMVAMSAITKYAGEPIPLPV